MQGQIIKINSNLYSVKASNNIYLCKCRGIFRNKHITPVVGDYVFFSEKEKLITEILPRKNIFKRPKVSNIDQAILVTSLKEPNLSLNLLDKFLVLMEINKVEPIICITKEDLLNKKEKEEIDKILNYYKKIGYIVLKNTNLEKIKEKLKNKTSVFTGQTGAGKSTLLNKLNKEWDLKTGEVSHALGRGKHTTRVVELFSYLDGKVMDTPGFSSLEFNEYSKEEIRNAFIEFSNYTCPFKDCTHTKELNCLVKNAFYDNNILESRYKNYLYLIGEDVNEN